MSPSYATIKGWSERSDLENTLHVVGAAIALIWGLSVLSAALGMGPFYWVERT